MTAQIFKFSDDLYTREEFKEYFSTHEDFKYIIYQVEKDQWGKCHYSPVYCIAEEKFLHGVMKHLREENPENLYVYDDVSEDYSKEDLKNEEK